jgi:tetratricopeptide (TPR) repeat protein
LAIREYLNTARAALDRGERTAALDALNAALALDPDYLAAQALKERVERASDIRQEFPAGAASPRRTEPAELPRETFHPPMHPRAPEPPPASPPPLVSAEGWARFESRARARRVEKRSAAARTLIERGRFDQARSIVDEIREIDPAHPDLISLAIELDAAEHLQQGSSWHWGPALAAVTVFAALLFGARYLEMPGLSPQSPPASAPVANAVQPTADVPAPQPDVPAAAEPETMTRVDAGTAPPVADAAALVHNTPAPTATSLVVPPPSVQAAPAAPPSSGAEEQAALARPDTPVAPLAGPERPEPEPVSAPPAPQISPAVTPAALPGIVPTEPPPDEPAAARVLRPDATPAAVRAGGAAVIPVVPDEERVRRTLQLYQRAYDTLDAQSAQAVWPRVDGVALQRAFDGLASQRLTFDKCDVQVSGVSGFAVCRGSTRYVPKVGSREPRIEPRTWTFALRKAGEQWQIDSARAER